MFAEWREAPEDERAENGGPRTCIDHMLGLSDAEKNKEQNKQYESFGGRASGNTLALPFSGTHKIQQKTFIDSS